MSIATVLYDYLPAECEDIRANLYDFTKFKMQAPTGTLNIVETKTLTTTLKSLADTYDWAVVFPIGTWLDRIQLIAETVAYGEQNNSPLVGQLLEKGGYYYFHQQWFAINLKTWQTVGAPAFEHGAMSSFTTTKVARSTENVHDDYTPLWLKPTDETQTYTTEYDCFGTKVVRALIEHGYTLVNVPDSIRHKKSYCYPEFSHDEIRQLIADPDFVPTENSALWWFNRNLIEMRSNLQKGYYLLNTEPMASNIDISNECLDCFVGVCGGFKPAMIAGNDQFAINSSINLFDASTAAIDWQKYLLENWDGNFDNFELMFNQFQNLHPDYVAQYFAYKSIDENIEWFLASGNVTRQEFQRRWLRYKQMSFTFTNLNLLDASAADTISALIKPAEYGTYIWTSNCFYMDYLMFFKTELGARAIGEKFIQSVVASTTTKILFENTGYIRKFNYNAK